MGFDLFIVMLMSVVLFLWSAHLTIKVFYSGNCLVQKKEFESLKNDALKFRDRSNKPDQEIARLTKENERLAKEVSDKRKIINTKERAIAKALGKSGSSEGLSGGD